MAKAKKSKKTTPLTLATPEPELDLSKINLDKYVEDEEVAPPTYVPRKFEYKRLSASMMKTWLSCRRKFHKQYVEGIKSPPNPSFSLGTSVHFALEQATLSLQQSPRELTAFEIDSYVAAYRKMASTLNLSDMGIFNLGETLVRDELRSFRPEEVILGVEKEFDLVTPEGVRIYGFIDKVTLVGEDTIKITDYKTSINPITYEEARSDEQLSMYDLAIRMLYPDYSKRILELRYVRSRTSVTSYRSDIESSNFRKQLLAVSNSIKEYMETLPPEAPPGELNTFCHWCSFRDSCPEYVTAANTVLPSAPSSFAITEDNFIETYEKVSVIAKAADVWKDLLKTWVVSRLEHDPSTLVNGNKEVGLVSASRRDYDVVGLLKLIPLEDLLGKRTGGTPLVKFSNSVLEDYIKEVSESNPKIRQEVEELVTIKYNSPMVKIKKKK